MKITFIVKLLFLVFILQVFTGCRAMVTIMAKSQITVEKGAIPPDFGENVDVLLCILQNRNSFDRYLKRHVKNQYHGNYEFILENELRDAKYRDFEKYRYVFRVIPESKTRERFNHQTNRFENQTTYTNTYYIEDRKMKKKYTSPMTSSFFSRVIKVYMQKLEEERRKYN